MELSEFLLARIAEDEEAARKAGGRYSWSSVAGFVIDEVHDDDLLASHDHIARWDPARVLAECDAKRAIIAEHQRWTGKQEGDGAYCSTCVGWPIHKRGDLGVAWPCPTLRALALSYAGDEDYREEWRPQ